jgi:hypothetical protein
LVAGYSLTVDRLQWFTNSAKGLLAQADRRLAEGLRMAGVPDG